MKILEKKKGLLKHYHTKGPKIIARQQLDEKYFRNEEYKIHEKILNQERIVVSTGGGFVCRRDIMNKINKNNLSIYLKLSADNLHKRLKSNYKKRYLKNNDKLEVVHFIGGGQFEERYF